MCSKRGVQENGHPRPGLWAGTVCHASGGEIIDTILQENWEKMRLLVGELAEIAEKLPVVQEQE